MIGDIRFRGVLDFWNRQASVEMSPFSFDTIKNIAIIPALADEG